MPAPVMPCYSPGNPVAFNRLQSEKQTLKHTGSLVFYFRKRSLQVQLSSPTIVPNEFLSIDEPLTNSAYEKPFWVYQFSSEDAPFRVVFRNIVFYRNRFTGKNLDVEVCV